LVKGKNQIELIGDGGSEKLTVTINSEDKGVPPIGLNIKKREGFEKLDTTIAVQTSLSASKYLFDKDSNGITDEEKSNSSFDVSYAQEGRYFPMATVKTSSGVWYSSQKNISLDVKAKPTVKALADLAGLSVIDMQTFNHKRYYIFAKDNNVYKIDPKTNKIIQTIPVAGVNNAEGFFVDIEENIYIANTGANQIIKLSKADNYQQTIVINKAGSGDGELSQPKDLVVDSHRDNGRIYVLDAGNNRVQVFDGLGKYLYAFDGSTTPTGKLKNPTSMIGYFGQPLSIVDSGNSVIRTLQCSQGQPENETAVIKDGISSNIGMITLDSSLIVTDKGNKKILLYKHKSDLDRSIDVDTLPNIVISNDDISLIVANEGESGIKNLKIQINPKGAEPIDIAKRFTKAIINDDRATVEEILSYKQRYIDKLYGTQNLKTFFADKYKSIVSWKQEYHSKSYATVTAHTKDGSTEADVYFDIQELDSFSNTWTIKRFY